MIKAVKSFIKFLGKKNIIPVISIEELDLIKPPREVLDRVKSNDILTMGEIEQLVQACDNSRDRAIIMLLYETGARCGEIARLTWGDLTFSDVDCKVRLEDEKCGGERFPYVVVSIPYLLQYRNDRGIVKDDDFVFIEFKTGLPITYRVIDWLLEKIGRRAKFDKRVYPHLLRASRITNMVKEGYKESVIKKMMWQKITTPMFDHYLKLADKDVQKEIQERNGIIPIVKPKVETKPIKCVCGFLNEPTNVYCPKCARSLKDGIQSIREEISEADRELLKILKNPKVVEKLQLLAVE